MTTEFTEEFIPVDSDEFMSYSNGKLMYLGKPMKCLHSGVRYKIYGFRVPNALYTVGYYVVDTTSGQIFRSKLHEESIITDIKKWLGII